MKFDFETIASFLALCFAFFLAGLDLDIERYQQEEVKQSQIASVKNYHSAKPIH